MVEQNKKEQLSAPFVFILHQIFCLQCHTLIVPSFIWYALLCLSQKSITSLAELLKKVFLNMNLHNETTLV